MRIAIAGVFLFLVPIAAVLGYKEYQRHEARKQFEPKIRGQWQPRGEVLFFNATWCGPCRQMKPIVGGMRREGYRMRAVDVDQNSSLARQYGIRAVPTFVFLENGKEVNRFSGGTSADELRRLCDDPAYHN